MAVDDKAGRHTYGALLSAAQGVAARLAPLVSAGGGDGRQARVAYLFPRDHSYVVAQWAAWSSGAIGVPLADSYPPSELDYFLKDATPSAMLVHPTLREKVSAICAAAAIPVIEVSGSADAPSAAASAAVAVSAAPPAPPASPSPKGSAAPPPSSLIIYTSGTTGKPKGVLTSNAAMEAQMDALTTAWAWTPEDRILHVLPLHHVHGESSYQGCTCFISLVGGHACFISLVGGHEAT